MHKGVTAILLLGFLSGTAWAVDRPGQNFLLKPPTCRRRMPPRRLPTTTP